MYRQHVVIDSYMCTPYVTAHSSASSPPFVSLLLFISLSSPTSSSSVFWEGYHTKLDGSIRFVVVCLSASYKIYHTRLSRVTSMPMSYVCGVLIPRESDPASLFTGRPHPFHGPLSCLRADIHCYKEGLAHKYGSVLTNVQGCVESLLMQCGLFGIQHLASTYTYSLMPTPLPPSNEENGLGSGALSTVSWY